MPNFQKGCSDARKLAIWLSAALLLVGGLFNSAQAGPHDDTLYWSSAAKFENLNPYYDLRPEGLAFKHLVWDALFYREQNKPLFKPLLATKLNWISAKSVEVELRQGVVFHNGDPFTADDILETVRRLKDPEVGLPRHRGIKWIQSVKRLGPYKVRFDLVQPTPNLMELLSGPFVILPKGSWDNTPLDDNGRPNYSRMAPVGSGPYQVTRIVPDRYVEVERFRRYSQGPKKKSFIRRIKFETIDSSSERLAQLLNGRLDFIWRISKDAHQQLLRDGAPIQLIKSPSLRIAFLVMNRAGRNNENSPLRDVRIRRAIAHAIDRDEIAHKVFGSRLNVIQALCHPAQVGCIQDVRVYEYSPDTARELLEGSVFDGSSLIGPPIIIKWRNRIVDALDMWAKYLPGEPDDALEIRSYRNHPASLDIASYLKTVGIDAYVKEFSSFQTALANVQAGKVDLAHVTWASHGSFDLADLLNPLFRGGLLDYCNDVKINRWLNVAADTNDQKVRNHAYRNILVRLQDIACVLPLFSYTTFYAFSKQLDLMPALDDVPRFYSARWK